VNGARQRRPRHGPSHVQSAAARGRPQRRCRSPRRAHLQQRPGVSVPSVSCGRGASGTGAGPRAPGRRRVTQDAKALARPLVGGVVHRATSAGAVEYAVEDHRVTIYATGAVCTCPAFRDRRRGTCRHIEAVKLAQAGRAAAPPTVVIAEEVAKLDGNVWLRCRAEQVGGRAMVVLELFDGASLAVQASVRAHPHQVPEVTHQEFGRRPGLPSRARAQPERCRAPRRGLLGPPPGGSGRSRAAPARARRPPRSPVVVPGSRGTVRGSGGGFPPDPTRRGPASRAR
jgi:SWIM zinc finger